MNHINEILQKVDHTLLKPECTSDQIRTLVDEGIRFHTASVCIPPSYVKEVRDYLVSIQEDLKICTVIGFPNGYHTTAVKCFETEDAIHNGADEIDMVINIGWVKDGRYEDVLNEIRQIKQICGEKILKVIIETCLLTDEEIIKMCEIVSLSGADYIKTSTGFSTEGATFKAVELMARHTEPALKIKAAGGIASLEDADRFLRLGADRLGTSRVVRLLKH